jgi:23S rRNA (uracil1939-C5)-methyltransferase
MRKLRSKTLLKSASSARRQGGLVPGQQFAAQVRDLSGEGTGVVQHADGQVFFVPGVWPGEQVEVRVTAFKGRFGFAELVSIIEPSPDRVEPPCPYQGVGAGSCGGCPWQFVRYEAQLAAKQARVVEALAPFAPAAAIAPIKPSPDIFGYRNRAQLKTDGERLGYVAAGSNDLVDIENCLILTDKNQQTLQALRQQLPRRQWQPRRKGGIKRGTKGALTTLDIDESVNAASVSVNQRLPFQQGNSAQNSFMRDWLSGRLAPLDKQRPVLELFAGSGNFTQIIVEAGFTDVTAVEVVDDAMDALRAELPQVKTLACDLFSPAAAGQLAAVAQVASLLVLDPPRDGLKNDALKSQQGLFSKGSNLQDVIYISCNLATFTRDVQDFAKHGFDLVEVQPLDQFPHAPHIELLAHLRKS